MGVGIVANPTTTALADGQTPSTLIGQNGESLESEIHGKYYTVAKRGKMFTANVTAVTVHVISAAYVSTFALYNPVGSNVNLEIVDLDLGLVSATTVVNTYGLYWQGSPAAQAGTFSTVGVVGTNYFPGLLNASPGVGLFYSAYTHSGTPARIAIVGVDAATTSVSNLPSHYDFDGKLLLPPASVISLAATTAVSTASSVDIAIRWAEWPV